MYGNYRLKVSKTRIKKIIDSVNEITEHGTNFQKYKYFQVINSPHEFRTILEHLKEIKECTDIEEMFKLYKGSLKINDYQDVLLMLYNYGQKLIEFKNS